jgi:hypothetical protein
LILYREKDLDEAYKIDCKARTRHNIPWVKREEFMDLYMIQLNPSQLSELHDIPEVLLDSLNKIIDRSLHFEPENNK